MDAPTKTIKELSAEVVEEFAVFDQWLDKYEYIIDLGKSLPEILPSDKVDANLIAGCQSRVWLACRCENGRLWFTADSDAIITKGIISLLINVYDGQKAEEVAASDFGFIEEIGLKENLSPTRAGGLAAMILKIKTYAKEYAQG